jgi:threonine synthase
VIIVPVGSGPLLRGIHNGFLDLVDLGIADRRPRLIAVQTTACRPLCDAWSAGHDRWMDALESARATGRTIAEPIADPLRGYEAEGLLTLDAVEDADGTVVSVDDDEIITATQRLASSEGVLVEPAAAATLAALRRDEVASLVEDATSIVLVLTGHGVKEARGLSALAAGEAPRT